MSAGTETILLWGLVAGAFTAIILFIRQLFRGLKFLFEWRDDFREFLFEWRGRPAVGNRPATLGMVERVERIESQLKPNGGQSVYDKVTQVRNALVPAQRQGD